MRILLLSGGSGKRLWPLSNDVRSKQFLKLLSDSDGNPCSMLQRVREQLREAGISEGVTITASHTQADAILSQLGDINLVLEPERRNTFPAIALGCAHLYYNAGASPDEPVVVMPVDPCVDTGFFTQIPTLAGIVERGEAKLALMGVVPEFPTEKYGYIIPEAQPSTESGSLKVSRFKEKPSVAEAAEMIKKGALWNCGVFAFKLGYIIDMLTSRIPHSRFDDVLDNYSTLTAESFDYAVVERESSIAVLPYDGYWKDLGTWNTLTEEISVKTSGRVLTDDTCENTHAINELNIPLIVMGAKDLVIAASYDGILIADKDRSSHMKPLVEQVEQRPMYEEKRWGSYRVLDFDSGGSQKSLTKSIHMEPGRSLSYQTHKLRREVWVITGGEGELILDGKRRKITGGDVVQIPAGAKHAVRAVTSLDFIEVQIGAALEEDDITRFEHQW